MIWAIFGGVICGLLAAGFLANGIKNILAAKYTKGVTLFMLNIFFMLTPLIVVAIIKVEYLLYVGVAITGALVIFGFVLFLMKLIKK